MHFEMPGSFLHAQYASRVSFLLLCFDCTLVSHPAGRHVHLDRPHDVWKTKTMQASCRSKLGGMHKSQKQENLTPPCRVGIKPALHGGDLQGPNNQGLRVQGVGGVT